MPFLLFIILFVLGVQGNTEIVNFAASESNINLSTVAQWPILRADQNELQWELPPAPLNTPLHSVCAENSGACLHELWLKLDLDHESWAAYSKFTLRLSWPANFPADFLIQVLTPEELVRDFASSVSSFEQGTTRVRYARIRIVSASLPTPSFNRQPQDVPFILILEPLYLGILPATLSTHVLILPPLLLIAGLVASRVNKHLERIASQAREEISAISKRKSQ